MPYESLHYETKLFKPITYVESLKFDPQENPIVIYSAPWVYYKFLSMQHLQMDCRLKQRDEMKQGLGYMEFFTER